MVEVFVNDVVQLTETGDWASINDLAVAHLNPIGSVGTHRRALINVVGRPWDHDHGPRQRGWFDQDPTPSG
jgi:hypothetical protein